jgi:hypothetical protein
MLNDRLPIAEFTSKRQAGVDAFRSRRQALRLFLALVEGEQKRRRHRSLVTCSDLVTSGAAIRGPSRHHSDNAGLRTLDVRAHQARGEIRLPACKRVREVDVVLLPC